MFIDGRLQLVEFGGWCNDRPTVNDLFRVENGEDVVYWRDETGRVTRSVWDRESQRYRLTDASSPVSATTTPTPDPVTISNAALYDRLGDGILDYYQRLDEQLSSTPDLDERVAILDAELNTPYMDYPYPLQFWKATLLRLNERDAEALAMYVALYEFTDDLSANP
jgi:hypothetical protein